MSQWGLLGLLLLFIGYAGWHYAGKVFNRLFDSGDGLLTKATNRHIQFVDDVSNSMASQLDSVKRQSELLDKVSDTLERLSQTIEMNQQLTQSLLRHQENHQQDASKNRQALWHVAEAIRRGNNDDRENVNYHCELAKNVLDPGDTGPSIHG